MAINNITIYHYAPSHHGSGFDRRTTAPSHITPVLGAPDLRTSSCPGTVLAAAVNFFAMSCPRSNVWNCGIKMLPMNLEGSGEPA